MRDAGGRIVAASWAGTAVFAITAVLAAADPDLGGGLSAGMAATVALALFAIGILAFLAGYGLAVSRSRRHDITVAGLFLLQGSAPRPTRRQLLGSTWAQVAVALATAAARPYTSLAFGVLVPVYGLGLAGLWAARHGTFPSRPPARPAARPPDGQAARLGPMARRSARPARPGPGRSRGDRSDGDHGKRLPD